MHHIFKISAISAAVLMVAAPSAVTASAVKPASAQVNSAQISKPDSQKTKNSEQQAKTNKKPASWIEIPEPSNLFMLALGITGLIAGRYAAKRNRKM